MALRVRTYIFNPHPLFPVLYGLSRAPIVFARIKMPSSWLV